MSFTLSKKTAKANQFRATGSTILQQDTKNLSIVYNKYKTNSPLPSSKNQIRYNLIFTHGTGFNKSVWNYLIKKLYQLSQSGQVAWFLDSVIAIDAVGHGDSALANEGKLGPIYTWYDGSKDVIEVVKHEQKTCQDFLNDYENRNIIVGHSMGGYIAIHACYLEPSLFDACIPVEAVYFGAEGGFEKFKKLFGKISKMMIDTFDSKEEVDMFFKQFYFSKNFHPEVLEDYIKDEIYEIKDKETGETKYKLKNNINLQIAAYYGAFISIPQGMLSLPQTQVPIFHVIGSKATWNPPESITWIRNTINPKYLAGTYDIPEGEHLVNSERPDDVIDIIKQVLTKRNQDFKKELQHIPELKSGNEPQIIAEDQFEKLFEQKFDEVYGYQTPKEEFLYRMFKL
ncbi:unnamed protein product [Candida verbasci]|uniref:AB hydrolase-1 domain-containing protein n=1 Tax=Candida verbasci TaxID=1227364 RepID=A0A9W4TTN7_9ASCO|nr:unnamed protein product [Candida verbasci]